VLFPHPKIILSASRDATVRFWDRLNTPPPSYDCTVLSQGSAFINAISFLPRTSEHPDGLVISGGKDTIIEIRQLGKAPKENADALLLGHAHNVCSLDVSPDGRWIVSGSWDATARVWGVGKWECEAVLEGHEGSVWDVLAYDGETVITGMSLAGV
jgi:phospholipase A-2-activating protein